ncbi:ACT domain-containing protein [candidate division KSB1 bacterium]|nr:ACT domain-containing protein [candidate division KSB1 bacterium]
MEKVVITGVAANHDVAMIDINGIDIRTTISADILGEIAKKEINIFLLCSNRIDDRRINLSIIVHPQHVQAILEILDHFIYIGKIESVNYNSHVEQVSIVGSGIANNCGVAYQMFNVLAQNKIEVLMSSTSEIKISAIVPRGLAQRAVSALHQEFKLNGLQRKFFGQVLN